jgi:pilus assembly protein CpaB
MNVMRFAILALALIAATTAVLLARGMLGGGTPATQAATSPQIALTEVLVAAKDISPGQVLEPASVRWAVWPKNSVPGTLISKDAQPDVAKAVEGMVVRMPLIAGQPVAETSVVRAGTAGFLAATVKPGLRAIGITVSAATSAGGFILPNDRVDVVLTRDVSNGTARKDFMSQTILRDVRVLAIDQTAKQEKDKDSVLGKTATLELTLAQSEILAQAEQEGVISLALRALGDSTGEPATADDKNKEAKPTIIAAGPRRARSSDIVVFRYGHRRGAGDSVVQTNTAQNNSPEAAPSTQQANVQ